jgi:glucosamine--fructose-6-phosphate aminotransferase (isomerizing)
MSGEFRSAIYSQPENLRAGREAFADAVEEVDLDALTRGTIVFSGVGASAHALTPAVLALRAAKQRAFAISPGQLREARAAALGDAFVLVSQSGASAEIVQALAHLGGAPIVAVSAHGDSPLAEAAGAWLPLGPFPDTPVATLSYTATLQALGMLCGALLGTSSGWQDVAELANNVLGRTEPVIRRIASGFASVVAIDAVGGGAAEASAGETALLAREGLRMPAVGMETREYLHGPLEAVNDGFGCVVFGRDREQELAAELTSFGANVTLITDELPAAAPGVHTIEIPHVPDLVAPILQILPVQLLIDHVARLRGLEIGKLRRQQADTKVVA